MDFNKRVAVIASGDLSHALSTDAPAVLIRPGRSLTPRFRTAFFPQHHRPLEFGSKVWCNASGVRFLGRCLYLWGSCATWIILTVRYSYDRSFWRGLFNGQLYCLVYGRP